MKKSSIWCIEIRYFDMIFISTIFGVRVGEGVKAGVRIRFAVGDCFGGWHYEGGGEREGSLASGVAWRQGGGRYYLL